MGVWSLLLYSIWRQRCRIHHGHRQSRIRAGNLPRRWIPSEYSFPRETCKTWRSYFVWVALIELVNATANKWISAKAVRRWVNAMCCCDHPLWSNEESAAAVDSIFSSGETTNIREPSFRCFFSLRKERASKPEFMRAIQTDDDIGCSVSRLRGQCFWTVKDIPTSEMTIREAVPSFSWAASMWKFKKSSRKKWMPRRRRETQKSFILKTRLCSAAVAGA